ncbi:MAG: phosphoenolpyruvate-utilizing N-terminal domain-containing protein, partial [Balneolaceae bacterium]
MSNHKSRNISGIPASPGIGIGKVWVLNNETKKIHPEKIDNEEITEHEEKLDRAIKQVVNEHKDLKNDAEDEEIKQIIEAQIQILKDPELNDTIR